MDPRLIDYYNDELQHLRREAGEFGAEFKEAAGMLALNKGRVEDPYVERLLEGVAFLAARVRLKLDAQYPVFTQQLVDILFPGWLSPSPSACILRMNLPESDEKLLGQGLTFKRGSCVRGTLRGAAGVRCEFETTRDLQLLPLSVTAVQYTAASPEPMPALPGQDRRDADSSLRIEITLTGAAQLEQLDFDQLPFYVTLGDPQGSQLLELVAGRCIGIGCSTDPAGRRDVRWLSGQHVRHIGFDASEAMLKMPSRGHAGFRVMREYAALPEKFRFFELTGLKPALKGLRGRKLYLHLHLGSAYGKLESAVRADSLALFCVPAINLRERELNRIDLQPGQTEYNVVGDRTDVKRYEIVQLLDVRGEGAGEPRRFLPVFEVANSGRLSSSSFYTVRRERRRYTEKEVRERRARLHGTAAYGAKLDVDAIHDPGRGTEMFIALAERDAGPQGHDLQCLAVRALCMDREVPALLRNQAGLAHYEPVDSVPIKAIDCLAGPSEPLDYAVDGFDPWMAMSHLHVNYLALVNAEGNGGADALRAMLSLYAPSESHLLLRQAKGLAGVETRQVTRRLPGRGALAFARGVEVVLTMTDRGFDGGSPYLLGAMLDHCLASHVSINSFVETSVVMKDWPLEKALRWQRIPGQRPTF
ncbi:MAG: type VI secretion system baseplate subunit TssF [Rubrivivax sp.]|nr:type VI secretion system baseplate subunit TssF [Rubrivivax sp.]